MFPATAIQDLLIALTSLDASDSHHMTQEVENKTPG